MSSLDSSVENVQVYVRVRPPNERELQLGYRPVLDLDQQACTVTVLTKPDATVFTYDHVAGIDSTQEDVFQKVGKPITDTCLAGYNGTIFAYGQTGSGKTHTIQGAGGNADPSQRGMMPRVFQYMCAQIAREERKSGGRVKYSVRASFLEIYNERIYDLLEPNSQSLTLREDAKNGVFVDNLTEVTVSAADEILRIMETGVQNRRVGETAMNRESSRSHSVFRLVLQSTETQDGLTKTRNSQFNMIDLAGSERQKSTAAAGKLLKEASGINKSLSALGNVIMALVAESRTGKQGHVHYRDSKLTFLLRDALGGNSMTHIIACVSSAPDAFGETLTTLKFAQRAKLIKNRAVVNEDHTGSIEALQAENQQLKENIRKLTALQHVNSRRLSVNGCPTAFADFMISPNKEFQEIAWARPPDGLIEESLGREKSWQESNKMLKDKVDLLENLLRKHDKQHLSNKMILKFRERALERMEARLRNESTESGQELLFSELERLQQENKAIREQLECNPGVVAKMVEISTLRLKLNEAESRQEGLTFEERYGLSKEVVELRAEKTRLEADMKSPRKLLSAMTTPHKRAFESFELQRWQREQDFEKQLKTINDELTGAKEEAIGYKAFMEDVDAEKEAALRELRDARSALNEHKTLMEVTRLRHEAEICRLTQKQQQDEEKLMGVYEAEIKALSSANKQSCAQEQSSSFELAIARTKLGSCESELKAMREQHVASLERETVQNERLNGLINKMEGERADFASKLVALGSVNSSLLGEISELKSLLNQSEVLITKLNAEAGDTQAKLGSMTEKLDTMHAQLTESMAQESAARTEADCAEQKLDEGRAEISRLNMNFEMLQEEYDSQEKAYQFQVGELTSQKERTEADLKTCSQDLAKAQEQVKALTEECDSVKKERLYFMAKGTQEEQEASTERQKMQEDIAERTATIRDLNEALESESTSCAQYAEEANLLKQRLDEAQVALKDTRAMLSDVQNQLETRALREQCILEELTEKAEQLLRKEEEVAQLMSDLHGLESELKAKEEESSEEAVRQRQTMAEFEQLSQTLETSKLELDQREAQLGALTEAYQSSQADTAHAREQLKQQLETTFQLQEAVATLQESLASTNQNALTEQAQLSNQITSLKQELKEKHLLLSAQQQELEDERRQQVLNLEERYRALQQRHETSVTAQETQAQKLAVVAHDFEALRQVKEELQSRIEELAQANKKLASQLTAPSKMDEVSRELEIVKTRVGCLNGELKAASERAATFESDANTQILEVARLEALRSSLEAQLKNLNDEKQRLQEECKNCRGEEERAFKEAEGLRQQLSQAQEECARAKSETERMTAEVANLVGHSNPQQKIKVFQKAKEENVVLRTRVHFLELELRKLTKENTQPSDLATKRRVLEPAVGKTAPRIASPSKRLVPLSSHTSSPRSRSVSPVKAHKKVKIFEDPELKKALSDGQTS